MNPGQHHALEEIEAYGQAARTIVADEALSDRDRHIAIVRLVERARAEALIPSWCQQAIWREVRAFLGNPAPPDLPPVPPEPVERACRSLRAQGYAMCPRCERPLPEERDFARWSTIRRAGLEEALLREADRG